MLPFSLSWWRGLDLNQRPPGCRTEIAFSGYVLDAAQKTTKISLMRFYNVIIYHIMIS